MTSKTPTFKDQISLSNLLQNKEFPLSSNNLTKNTPFTNKNKYNNKSIKEIYNDLVNSGTMSAEKNGFNTKTTEKIILPINNYNFTTSIKSTKHSNNTGNYTSKLACAVNSSSSSKATSLYSIKKNDTRLKMPIKKNDIQIENNNYNINVNLNLISPKNISSGQLINIFSDKNLGSSNKVNKEFKVYNNNKKKSP